MFATLVEFFSWGRTHWLGAIGLALLAMFGFLLYEVTAVVVPALTSEYLADRTQFKTAIASYSVLDDDLNRLRTHYNAGRVGLFRFHNGSRDVQGVAFYFVSVATMVGVSVDLKSVTDLNAAIFAPAYESLNRERKPWCTFTRDVSNGPLKDLAESRGDIYFCLFPIDDLKDNLSGFMSITWLDSAMIPPENERYAMQSDLQDEVNKMSGYFLWTDGAKK